MHALPLLLLIVEVSNFYERRMPFVPMLHTKIILLLLAKNSTNQDNPTNNKAKCLNNNRELIIIANNTSNMNITINNNTENTQEARAIVTLFCIFDFVTTQFVAALE